METFTEQESIRKRLAEIIPLLTPVQLRFVAAMQTYADKKDAAHAIGIQPNTVYKWPDHVDEVVHLMALDTVEAARQLLKSFVVKAAIIKGEGLDSDNESLRQKVASEILAAELEIPVSAAPTRPSDNAASTRLLSDPTTDVTSNSLLPMEFRARLEMFLSQASPEKQMVFLAHYESWAETTTKMVELLKEGIVGELEEPKA